ncbi:MAG: DUF2284 domain-containing protein [Oscillospiraceae bacterium]
MKIEEKKELIGFLKHLCPAAEGVFMNPADLVFEENVKMNCFYCGKYGNNWMCPPNIPNIDYPKMFSEYNEGLFVVLTNDMSDKKNYDAIRTESSIIVHKALLELEKWMWNHNCSNAISFGAGSCKLCKGGCGKERCNNPYMARSPLEATGVNVIKSARKVGIDIRFPADKKLMRVGLLLWQYEEN